MRKNKSTIIFIVAIVVILVFLFAYPRMRSKSGSGVGSGVPCLVPNIPLTQHIHPHLQILVDGVNEFVSANIGLSGCERALHTHDETGEIHVEAQDKREYTLGDFMSVWGKTIERLGYRVVVEVDGEVRDNPNSITFEDKQQILVKYDKISQ